MTLAEWVGELAPWAATIISFIIALLAHNRAKDAQKDQTVIDKTRLIQEGYQGLLDNLQSEINRLKRDRNGDKEEWNARERRLLTRISDLDDQLSDERTMRVRLEQRVEALTAELANVEKRNGFYNEHSWSTESGDGAADGGV